MSTMIINPASLNFSQPSNQQVPDEGPKAIPLLLDFSGSVGNYTLDFLVQQQQGFFSMLQTIYVDNSQGTNDVTITLNISNQKIVAKAGTQGYYSVLCPNPIRLTFSSAINGVIVPVFLINVPISGMVWSAT